MLAAARTENGDRPGFAGQPASSDDDEDTIDLPVSEANQAADEIEDINYICDINAEADQE